MKFKDLEVGEHFVKDGESPIHIKIASEWKNYGSKNSFNLVECSQCDVSDDTRVTKMRLDKYCFHEVPDPILNKKEKAYLEAVIRPWRDKVACIEKDTCSETYSRLKIECKGYGTLYFPMFETKEIYIEMTSEHPYTVKELGLFEDE